MFLVHIWFAICILVFFPKKPKKITFFKNTHPANDKNPAQVLGAGISVFLGISTSLFSTEGRLDVFFNPIVHFKKGGDIALRMWRKIAAL